MRNIAIALLFVLYTLGVLLVGGVVGWGSSQFGLLPARLTGSAAEQTRPILQAWEIVNRDFVNQPIDADALVTGAITGMLTALDDPYTRYLTPAQQQIDLEDLEGEFQGIGAYIEFDEALNGVIIVSPIEGSPAEAAGLAPGDVLRVANGVPIDTIETALNQVRGPAGSTVTLTVERAGELLTFEIVRGVITLASVEGEVRPDGIAYIRLRQFGFDTTASFRATLADLLAQSPRGLIIDVRNNPGGLLNTVVDVADELLGEGVILTERFGNGRERVFRSDSGDPGEQIPLVVLVNEGSASASEVLAGAVTARERGTLVGTTTFGKGSVQQIEALSNGGGLRVTVAAWLLPDGSSIAESGLAPDLVVEAGAEADGDPQLAAAVDLLLRQTAER